MLLRWPTFVTSRRINCPVDALTTALDSPGTVRRGTTFELGRGDVVVLDGPFRETWCWPRSEWRTTGCLYQGRNRPVARLQLTVAAWSHDASELSLRPVSMHPERWGRRRTQRYFALAHDAADQVAAHLRDTELFTRRTSARPLVGAAARSHSEN
jgi:hypothetical protein